MKAEYERELKMSYDELGLYLQHKYGLPKRDYFATEECRSKSKNISRTSEGLFCHHICEKYASNLGEPHMARQYTYEYQKREKLAYCDYIEHLILHLKINVMSRSHFGYAYEINHFFNSLGFFWICAEVNELYKNRGSLQKWRNDCYTAIKDSFEDYVDILKGTICFVEDNYNGDRKLEIKKGTKLYFDTISEESFNEKKRIRGKLKRELRFWLIEEVDDVTNTALVKSQDGDLRKLNFGQIKHGFEFNEILNEKIKTMCALYPETEKWDDLEKMLVAPNEGKHKDISGWLKEGNDEVII